MGVIISELRKEKDVLKKIQNLLIYSGLFVGGLLLVSIPIIVWLTKNDAFGEFIEEYFVFNSLYAKTSIKGVILSFVFFIGQPVVVLTLPALVYLCFEKRHLFNFLCLVSFIGYILASSLGNMQFGQYGFVFVPFFTWAIACLSEEHIILLNKRFVLVTATICLMFISSIFTLCADVWRIVTDHHPEMDEAKAIAKVILDNTEECDKISVCGNMCVLYMASDRMSSSVYAYQTPLYSIKSEVTDQYLDDIEKKKPKLIIMTDWEMPLKFRERMNEILDEQYSYLETVGNNKIYSLKCD